MTQRARRRRDLKVAVQLIVALTLTCTVRAFAGPDNPTANAKSLYENGVTDYNLGHYEEALVSFEQAYRIRHDSVFLFDIGQCQRQLRRYEDAERSYRAYLRETPNLSESTRGQVQKLIAEMRKADDDAHSKGPLTRPQAPAPGDLRAQPTAQPQVTAAPLTASATTGERRMVITGLAVAAFGVASIAVGGGFYALARSANDQLNHPSNGIYSESAENGRDTFQSLDIAAFSIGGAAAIAGSFVAVLGWRQRHHLTITPVTTNRSVGASLRVGF